MATRKKKGTGWGRIVFHFKTDKVAWQMARFIMFGKEMGLIPETIEIQYDGLTVTLGHYLQ